MSSPESAGSLTLQASQKEMEDTLSAARLNFSNTSATSNPINSNVHNIEKSNNRTTNHKNASYKYKNTNGRTQFGNPDNLAAIEPSDDKDKSITHQMNQALDIFNMFECAADSETGEIDELETERAIIREMCNVVIKGLDSNKE